ncbi:MAG: ATP-binding protein [Chitinophagales bacterium]
MKLLIKIFFFLVVPVFTAAQQDLYFKTWSNEQADSLKTETYHTSNDTLRMFLCRCIGFHYQETNRDSSLYFHEQELSLARKLQLKLWEGDAMDQAGWVLSYLKNYPRSLQYFLEGIKILENPDCEKNIWLITLFSKDKNPRTARLTALGFIYNDLSQLYKNTGNKEKELASLYQGLKIGKSINNSAVMALITANLSLCYFALDRLDSSLLFGQQSLQQISISGYKTYKGYVLNTIGNVYLKQNQFELAKQYFDSSINANIEQNSLLELPNDYLSLAGLYKSLGKMDTALYYAKKALADEKSFGEFEGTNQAYSAIYDLYKATGNADSAYAYLQLSKTLSDSLNKAEKDKIYLYQNIGFNEQLKIKEQENERMQRENRIRIYTLIGGIFVFMLIAFLLYRNSRTRRKANELLQQQKKEIEIQKRNVEGTLAELKSTQSQLIQSEKMASLGELTAGIAHEIQNPLNFVNNFSEVNNELIDELKTKKSKLKMESNDEQDELLNDIYQNNEKISFHGKRADAIVKGMLQHSRSSSGVKEPTDINALADEYLRLAYHGLRAKDNSFNATMKTDFDETIGNINIIPQDIGRVILNLITNAFYAAPLPPEGGFKEPNYKHEPTVWVSTKKVGGKVLISVRDNGPGIPQKVIDKIFQPFFTTKPTGQGTGLGLSLSYDIVKAHGGEIKVETKEAEGTTFIIQLPVS